MLFTACSSTTTAVAILSPSHGAKRPFLQWSKAMNRSNCPARNPHICLSSRSWCVLAWEKGYRTKKKQKKKKKKKINTTSSLSASGWTGWESNPGPFAGPPGLHLEPRDNAKRTLYQLSHTPRCGEMAVDGGTSASGWALLLSQFLRGLLYSSINTCKL